MPIVVIIEDTSSVASSLALAVETIPGVQALVARNPRSALRLFHNGRRIAAVITDLNLPEMDGFELIGRLRQFDSYSNLPAIMITAEENATASGASKECRPDVILQKPFSPKEVCRVLESLLS